MDDVVDILPRAVAGVRNRHPALCARLGDAEIGGAFLDFHSDHDLTSAALEACLRRVATRRAACDIACIPFGQPLQSA